MMLGLQRLAHTRLICQCTIINVIVNISHLAITKQIGGLLIIKPGFHATMTSDHSARTSATKRLSVV